MLQDRGTGCHRRGYRVSQEGNIWCHKRGCKLSQKGYRVSHDVGGPTNFLETCTDWTIFSFCPVSMYWHFYSIVSLRNRVV